MREREGFSSGHDRGDLFFINRAVQLIRQQNVDDVRIVGGPDFKSDLVIGTLGFAGEMPFTTERPESRMQSTCALPCMP